MKINYNSKWYRFATIWHAFKMLYQLTPQQVNSFLKAYQLYDYEWVQGQAVSDKDKLEYEEVKQGLIDWYAVINHLCAIGEVEKMYIPPTLDPTKNVINNQGLFEERIYNLLGIKQGDNILELGCGKGRVAAHIASATNANITGINIEQSQLDSANLFAEKNQLTPQCKFVNKDFNELPFTFADNSFDHIYENQALSLCRDLDKLFQELHRMLKPGGKLSLLEWVRLPDYNPENPHHADLMRKIKPLIGAIGTPSPQEYEQALERAGFKVLVSEDPSINQSQEILINQSGSNYDRFLPFIKFLVKIKILPTHFIVLIDRLSQDVDALSEADRLGLVTMSHHLVVQKIS